MAKALRSSYTVVDYLFVKALVITHASELVLVTMVGWILDDNQGTVTLRARSQKQLPVKILSAIYTIRYTIIISRKKNLRNFFCSTTI